MRVATEPARKAWKNVKELHLRLQSATLPQEEYDHLHIELRRAVARFRRAYAQERLRREAAPGPVLWKPAYGLGSSTYDTRYHEAA